MPSVYHTNPADRTRLERDITAEIAQDKDVAFAYLYGSFVEAEGFHDIDVGIYLNDVNERAAESTESDLAQRLTARLKIPVDIRVLNAASVPFLYHVLRGKLILSRNDDLLARVMENTVRRYLDIAPLLRHSAKEAFAG